MQGQTKDAYRQTMAASGEAQSLLQKRNARIQQVKFCGEEVPYYLTSLDLDFVIPCRWLFPLTA